MRALWFAWSLFSCVLANAQVNVDAPVQLIGANAGDRQVLGLDSAQQAGHALDAATNASGKPRWAGNATGAAWAVSLPKITGGPTAGTSLVVRTQVQAPGAVTLNVNGTLAYPVMLAPNVPLEGDALPEGTMVSLVFDGSSFQVTNGVRHARRDCPAGMVGVSDQFCIEVAERPAGTFYDAAVACAQSGGRMCTWSEWQQACLLRVQLGLQLMIGNWEWTNDSANEDLGVRVVGNTSCTVAGVTFATEPTQFSRCCYSR